MAHLILASFGVSDIPEDVPAHPKEKNARRISASSRFTIFTLGCMSAASSSRAIPTNFNIITGIGLFYLGKENISKDQSETRKYPFRDTPVWIKKHKKSCFALMEKAGIGA